MQRITIIKRLGPAVHGEVLPALCLAFLVVKFEIAHRALGAPIALSTSPSLTTIALCAALATPLAWARTNRLSWALAINAIGSIVALADLWHYRFYGDVLSIAQMSHAAQLPSVWPSVQAVMDPKDLLALTDLVLIGGLAAILRRRLPLGVPAAGRWLRGVVPVVLAAGVPSVWNLADNPGEVFTYETNRSEVVAVAGLPGYHMYDLAITVRFPLLGRATISRDDLNEVMNVLDGRRQTSKGSALRGTAAGMNVIVIAAESLQSFAIDLVVEHQAVAPHLSAFARESLLFANFFDQTHVGSTADAEFMVLNSVLPPAAGVVATRYESNGFRSLPHVLAEHRYLSVSACGTPPSFWNMREVHARQGFHESWFLPDFRADVRIGHWLADAVFFREAASRLAGVHEPFFAFLITSSSHHPYRLPAAQQRLSFAGVPASTGADYLQAVNYLDAQFGSFVDDLARTGLLDRTVLVVMGDHQAWLTDADLRIIAAAGGSAAPLTPAGVWRMRYAVPLMVRLPRAVAGARVPAAGGAIDVAPTLLGLLGIADADEPFLGRDLLEGVAGFVGFPDGSFTDGVRTYLAREPETRCWLQDAPTECDSLVNRGEEARQLRHVSDRIVTGNLATRLRDRRPVLR